MSCDNTNFCLKIFIIHCHRKELVDMWRGIVGNCNYICAGFKIPHWKIFISMKNYRFILKKYFNLIFFSNNQVSNFMKPFTFNSFISKMIIIKSKFFIKAFASHLINLILTMSRGVFTLYDFCVMKENSNYLENSNDIILQGEQEKQTKSDKVFGGSI